MFWKDWLKAMMLRGVMASAVGGLGWWLLVSAGGGGLADLPQMLAGLCCFIVAAVILAPGLARLFGEPMGSLFYPRQHYDRPQPMYGIAERLRKEGNPEEAREYLEEILAEHPEELRGYIELIDLAVADLKDGELARATYERGMASLKEGKDRLEAIFRAEISRLAPRLAPGDDSRGPGGGAARKILSINRST